MDDSTTVYISFDLETLQISKEATEQSEACENNGIDTSMFSGDDEVNLLSPSFKVATSIFDETGKLIEFDPLDHFEKA